MYTVCEHSQCLPLCMYVGGRAWLCSHCILSPCYTSVPYPLCSLSTLNIRHAWTPVGLRSPPSSKDLRLACAAVLHIPHVPSCICPRDALVTGAGLLLPSALWWLSAHTADGQHAYSPQSRLLWKCVTMVTMLARAMVTMPAMDDEKWNAHGTITHSHQGLNKAERAAEGSRQSLSHRHVPAASRSSCLRFALASAQACPQPTAKPRTAPTSTRVNSSSWNTGWRTCSNSCGVNLRWQHKGAEAACARPRQVATHAIASDNSGV